ncbi:MAG: CRISPR-associated helicase Cas3' [Ignavibacteriae bacterium]|nr:CRISPR-associated helicase Cas3' [Ignavibacteriota bacterium]NOG98575.1 CRISPR-associated helicase Cas3' [Ignavibacteriota bacterium]
MFKDFIAHVKQNNDGTWVAPHLLNNHLNSVGKIAGKYSKKFNNEDWGHLIGYWHDLGKYHPDWQNYIRRETGYPEDAHLENQKGSIHHSTPGAVLAFERFNNSPAARIAAYTIAGHHAGLNDWVGGLDARLFKKRKILNTDDLNEIKKIAEAQKFISKKIPESTPIIFANAKSKNDYKKASEHLHLWIRMLFSSLVDADFIDTEKYMDYKVRGEYLSLEALNEKFVDYMQEKKIDSEINKKRHKILQLCREKAELPPGFFSLNVPTGGGKTLSSIAFALEHAIKHNKDRIIMAIPYTSIIEQTAKVFKYGSDDEKEIQERLKSGKLLFGEEQVIEHHSNIDPEKETTKNRLAAENWDAPIIVTTNVQLFESLFASRTSPCRKLHNIVNSIIILDEAQMIPPEYLKPILSVLKGLVEHFSVTVLLMTATQPALEGTIGSKPDEIEGIKNISHIIDNPESLSKSFERVEISFPEDLNLRKEWTEIASELINFDQVLCIVNRRDDCRELHSLMPEETVHLSGYMCGEERSEIISKIKLKLKRGEAIRVISTQLVEAGVDIDFPVVYRALAGLDSIAQAAGRCNRENKLANQGQIGKVVVFNPPKAAPRGLLRKGEDAGKSIIRNTNNLELTPLLYKKYFSYFYKNLNTFDKPRFYDHLVKDSQNFEFKFRSFSKDFHLIDDKAQKSIVVWYKNEESGYGSEELINQLRHAGPSKNLGRKLQRFIVNVPQYVFEKIPQNYIEVIHGYYVQNDPNLYVKGLGLMVNESNFIYGDGVV